MNFKLLFTLTATLALTGCPLERENPAYLGIFPTDQPPPENVWPNVDLPDVPEDDPAEVPPDSCDSPDCEEVPEEDLVPTAHPGCRANAEYPEGVTANEQVFSMTEGEGIAFDVTFRVRDEADCLVYKLGDIAEVFIPEGVSIWDGGERERSPDGDYDFDPATGRGRWLGTRDDVPAFQWIVVVPVLDAEGNTVTEIQIALTII